MENTDDILNASENDGSDEEFHTVAEVLSVMEESWLNEKFAPELLPHKYEVVEFVLGQMSYVQQNVNNINNDELRRTLHQMELDRLQYLVSSYLRIRLEKIEMFANFILKQEEERTQRGEANYLHHNELEFAKSYKQSLDEHFTEQLNFWPGHFPDEWKNQVIVPNTHAFVFMKAKKEIEGVLVSHINEEEEVVDLKTGSQVIISYNSIGNLLKTNQSCLI